MLLISGFSPVRGMFLCPKWLWHPYPTAMNILFILQIKVEKEEAGQQSGVQVGVLKSCSVDKQNLISHERDKDQKKHWQWKLLPDLCLVPLMDVLCIVKRDRISDLFPCLNAAFGRSLQVLLKTGNPVSQNPPEWRGKEKSKGVLHFWRCRDPRGTNSGVFPTGEWHVQKIQRAR